jgi:type IV secretion system protein VirB8
MKRDPAIEQYLREAQGWERDVSRRANRSARIAWSVAAISCLVTALAVAAIAMLTPLKTVEPFLMRVDNTTGIIDVVPVFEGKAELPEVVTRHLLNNYVTSRERYFYATAETDYETVGAYNSPQLNSEWFQYWDRNNPLSPLSLYKDGTTVRAQIKAISFLKPASGQTDLAQVRFIKAARPGGSGQEQLTHWIATIQFAYIAPSKDERTRGINPMGLRIVDYRREPEVVAEATPPAAAAATIGAAR